MIDRDPNYSEEVERRFRAPPAAGELPPGNGVEVAAEAGSRAAGALVQLRALVDGERIAAVRFHAYGCPHLIAAASWTAEQLSGSTPALLLAWDWQSAAGALEVPPGKFGRLLVLQDAVRNLGIACTRLTPAA
jgi:NifU-like protein involved in Fe-S cluster formation